MVNTKYNSTEDMIDKLQELKCKAKLKFYKKKISNYYDNMNIRFDEDLLLKMLKLLVKFNMKCYC